MRYLFTITVLFLCLESLASSKISEGQIRSPDGKPVCEKDGTCVPGMGPSPRFLNATDFGQYDYLLDGGSAAASDGTNQDTGITDIGDGQ